ncbi:zinc ribbon domain-containing protein [Thermincola potens]|uniref:DNA-binding protein n=1 Tax=Thermincola potens (strain JR) TaxID=635013 RepID=D5XBZ5_THEPJ|nr:zinc ribbon domain-containing protein [Thermincola potens]ADG81543.1 conserved hypothetical protein [Thermincola potens JR]
MTEFIERLKRGAKAFKESFGPSRYSAGGLEITCPHCKNSEFKEGAAQLNTAGMTFMNLDWLNKSATTLICTRCGLIQWFYGEPERLD